MRVLCCHDAVDLSALIASTVYLRDYNVCACKIAREQKNRLLVASSSTIAALYGCFLQLAHMQWHA